MGWATTYITLLKEGKTVKFRPHGSSMMPRIKSGVLCTVEPLAASPVPGDVVLCTVNGRQFLHLVTAVKGEQFQISNNHNFVNGWCTIRQIYGKLIEVQP